MSNKKIIVGRLGDAHGIKGWLHLYSYTEPTSNIFEYPNWFIQEKNTDKPIQATAHQAHSDHFIVKLKNCDDRDQALLLKHRDIVIERDSLPALPENEYYWEDLVGLQVIDTHGKALGVIVSLLETGANNVIAVQGEKFHYIPYLPDVVKEISLEKKIMIVDWELL